MKYTVRYKTKDDDYSKVWVEANSKEEAEREARREYWDIKEITSVEKL